MAIPEAGETTAQAGIRKKPFLCRMIATMALTYFLILALLFLTGLIFSGKIAVIIGPYYGTGSAPASFFLWFAMIGTLMYFVASSGVILFMLNHKAGFYIFFAAIAVIMALDMAFLKFDWLRYLIHSGLFFLLGLAHISKKCYI